MARSEKRYTLEEAQAILRNKECLEDGHKDLRDVIADGVIQMIVCDYCDSNYALMGDGDD